MSLTIPLPRTAMIRAVRMKRKFTTMRDLIIIDWVATVYPGLPCDFGAVVLNWRGALHQESSALLRRLGVNGDDETLMSIRVLTYTANMFKQSSPIDSERQKAKWQMPVPGSTSMNGPYSNAFQVPSYVQCGRPKGDDT